jgi:hypothetical protein
LQTYHTAFSIPEFPIHFSSSTQEKMASDKGNANNIGACTNSNQSTSLDKKPNNTKGGTNDNLGKTLAQRALYGSHNHRVGGRKITNSSARSQPSRLSKVSLGEDSVG